MSNDKPRVPKEYWAIEPTEGSNRPINVMIPDVMNPDNYHGLYSRANKGKIHLIEYSAYEDLKAEIDRLKEIISYIPKVPTEPYEQAMAKEIDRLSKTLLGFGARNNKLREALVIAEDAIHSKYCGNDGCHAIHKEIEALEKGEE